MNLSSEDIKLAITSQEIIINNFDLVNLRPSSLCLTLDRLFTFRWTDRVVDTNDSATYPKSDEFLSFEDGYVLESNEFVLGFTKEEISINHKYQGSLSNISGLARLGLDTIASTHIASGFGMAYPKSLVLEIFNKSKQPIKLHKGMRICHLLLSEQITNSADGYDNLSKSKYGNNTPDSKY